MGNWQLEVGKMAIYMAFPVGTFYAYHQIEWFADQYKDMQRKVYSSEDPNAKAEFHAFLKGLKEHEEKVKEIESIKLEAINKKKIQNLETIKAEVASTSN